MSRLLLTAASVAMLLLAAAFFGQSIEGVSSGRTREFMGALSLAVAAPFAWLLVQLMRGRRAEAALSGIVCALLYVVGFGWLAVLLFVFSWGDRTFGIPVVGLALQFVSLIAASAMWRGQPRETRAAASWIGGGLVPVLCVLIPLAAAQMLRAQIAQLPTQRQTQASEAVQLVTVLQRCLRDQATPGAGSYPKRLEALSERGPQCASAVAAVRAGSEHTRVVYRVAPPTRQGARPAFTLCAQPSEVPDRGMMTVVADAAVVRQAIASDGARAPVSCEAAWASGAAGAIKRLQYCLLAQAASEGREFPTDLASLRRAMPDCVAEERVDAERATESVLRFGSGSVLGVQYLAGESAEEPATGYKLYVSCPGQVDKAVVDESGMIEPSAAALRWLNDCREAAQTELRLLAEGQGFRLMPAVSPTGAMQATAESGGIAPRATPVPEPEPRYGDVPDLEARRADCREQTRECYGLALELERSIHLEGANPHRDETLNAAQRTSIAEANRALQEACEAGRWSACQAWADVLLRGRGVEDDPPRALRLLQRGCASGMVEACVRSAELLETGREATRTVASSIRAMPGGAPQPIVMHVPDPRRAGIARNHAAAIDAFQSACTLGDVASCLRAARLALDRAESTEASRAETLASLRRLCESGQGFACGLLALQAAAHDGAVGGRSAAEWRRRACALGERQECRG